MKVIKKAKAKLKMLMFFHFLFIQAVFRFLFFGKQFSIEQSRNFYSVIADVIKDYQVNFIDIGASNGESIREAILNFKNLKSIIAVEPVINDSLINLINTSRVKIEFINKAVGCSGDININLNEHSGLNSVHEFNPTYKYIRGGKENFGTIKIECISLDDVIKNIDKTILQVNVLKIDTQGYEDNVLKSGMILKKGIVDFLFIEIILVEKYKSQANYLDVMNLLDELGFVLIDVIPFFKELDGKHVEKNKFGQFTESDLLYIHLNSIERFKIIN